MMRTYSVIWTALAVSSFACSPGNAQENLPTRPPIGPRTSLRFDSEPAYAVSVLNRVPGRVPGDLWIQAIEHGERSILCDAASAFAKAKREGFEGIPENAGPAMLSAFQKTDNHLSREALAAALIEFDDRSASDVLKLAVNQGDYRFDHLVEPALARWQVTEVLERNRQRLSGTNTLTVWKKHAIEVVSAGSDAGAVDALLEIVFNEQERSDLRLLAARGLGQINSDNLIDAVQKLIGEGSQHELLVELMAIEMLNHDPQRNELEILKRLAASKEPTVQAAVLELIQKMGATEVLTVVQELGLGADHPHAGLRETVLTSLYAIGDRAAVDQLATFLGDPVRANRELATDALFALAKHDAELRSGVAEHVGISLESGVWEVLEQSCLLAAGLEMGDTVGRMQELLNHHRPEVGRAAAYAMKVFANPDYLAAALHHFETAIEQDFDTRDERQRRALSLTCEQAQHLAEFMGTLRFRSADPVLQKLIPKVSPGYSAKSDPQTRAVAIWAVGQIRMGESDEQLVKALIARVNDDGGPMPEQEKVREACAYALGWMKADLALPALRPRASRGTYLRCPPSASAWAVSYLTGEEIPLEGPFTYEIPAGWFLEPPRRSDATE